MIGEDEPEADFSSGVLAPELLVVTREVVEVCRRMASVRKRAAGAAPRSGVVDESGEVGRERVCCRCRRRDWKVWSVMMLKTKQSQRGRMTGMRKMRSWVSVSKHKAICVRVLT
jgi:hypothetical protein